MTKYSFPKKKRPCVGCGERHPTIAALCWECYKEIESHTESIENMIYIITEIIKYSTTMTAKNENT